MHACAWDVSACMCAQPTLWLYMCVTRAALYLKTWLYFIGHFPSLLQSAILGPRPSKAKIEFSSFFNPASCPGFNKASLRVVGELGGCWVMGARKGVAVRKALIPASLGAGLGSH